MENGGGHKGVCLFIKIPISFFIVKAILPEVHTVHMVTIHKYTSTPLITIH